MSNAKKSKTAKEMLAAAKLPERSVRICLRGDLIADIEALEAELVTAVEDRKTNGRLSTTSQAKAIAEQIEAKRDEMSEAMLTIRVRAMKPTAWRELVRKYPSKDPQLAVDMLALMGEAIPTSTVSPDLDDEDWQNLNDNTAPAELGKLIDAVWELNTQGVDVPKSRLASVVNRRSSDD